MPKRTSVLIIAVMMLVTLLMATSCGTGDKGGVERIVPQDLASEPSGTGGGPTGGGGGLTCVDTFQGVTVCIDNFTQSDCQQLGGSWTTCPAGGTHISF